MTFKNIFGNFASLLGVAIVAAALVLLFQAQTVVGSAPSGLPAGMATSGPMAVTPTQSLVLATTTNCASRVITTQASAIRITINDINSFTPSGTQGMWQAASTTQVYDGGLYGCGAVRVHSQANQNIWVMDMF